MRKAKKFAQETHPSAPWESTVCAAHRLQTALKHALEDDEISSMLSAARKLVGHFKHSTKATTALKVAQKSKKPKKVIQDVSTRWNSSYYMLARLNLLHQPIVSVLSDKNVSKRDDLRLDLSAAQWALAEDICKALEPFEVATTVFSAEFNVSVSCVMPIMAGLTKTIKHVDDDLLPITRFKETLQSQLKRRFQLEPLNATSLAIMASALDPRFKNVAFLQPADVSAVRANLTKLMEIKEKPGTAAAASPSSSTSTDEHSTTEPSPKRSLWDLMGVDAEKVEAAKESPEEELQRFVAAESLQRDGDPLAWWKAKEEYYPRLAEVAKGILCIPVSSTSAERVFSYCGIIASHQRAAIKPENVDALVFLNRNTSTLFNMEQLSTDSQSTVFVDSEPKESATAEEQHPADPDFASGHGTASVFEESWEDI